MEGGGGGAPAPARPWSVEPMSGKMLLKLKLGTCCDGAATAQFVYGAMGGAAGMLGAATDGTDAVDDADALLCCRFLCSGLW